MQKLYTIYDSKSETYDRPWPALNKGIALRSVLEVLKEPGHPFSKWPADFTLFEIAEWDEQTGALMPYQTKVNIGVLIEFVSMASNSNTSARTSSEVQTLHSIQEDGNHGREQVSSLQN